MNSKKGEVSEMVEYNATEPSTTLDKNVILSKATELQLEETIAKIKYHRQIYDNWNFKSIDPCGKTIILNFYGKPGTGKTLAADAFAGTLNRGIIKLGISELESKFMGDTAKNIRKAFEDAHTQQAIIFFDEADTLLGKRLSSVTQGVDNEVNAMRSTLLIELEKFDGIVIFATNFVKNYDSAFLSRITHQIHFELPDGLAREKIWDYMLISEIDLDGNKLDIIKKCSELSAGFSGREIRTCMRLALPKPFLDGSQTLKLEHLKSAIAQVSRATQVGKKTNQLDENLDSIKASKNLLGV